MNFEEPFILGDARFLSGGAKRTSSETYDNGTPAVINIGEPIFTEADCGERSIESACDNANQVVYGGICNYHGHHGANHNIFIRSDDAWPSVGVEIETVFRPRDDQGMAKAHKHLVSNWFHFEHDSSLPRDGHEMVTEPLCPGIYRNLDTWIGLQNLMTPFATSFKNPETGLHVHVGTTAFKRLRKCAFARLSTFNRNSLARLVLATVYYSCDRELLDSVFLRRSTNYCATKYSSSLAPVLTAVSRGGVPFADIEDMILASEVSDSTTFLSSITGGADGLSCTGRNGEFNGHGSELNFPHRHTVEFRRGNGTLNGVSIHRMIEFCMLLVDFVRYGAENPDTEVSKAAVYDYIKSNTVSDALKDAIDRCAKKKEG